MVVGNGLLGAAFKKVWGFDELIFASGVSSSSECDIEAFNRERDLLLYHLEVNSHLKLVYFSTILVNSSNTPYYKHKGEMESLITEKANDYVIFRLPQVLGDFGNKTNLIQYLAKAIANGDSISVGADNVVERSIIDVEDVVTIVSVCLDYVNREIVNISGIEKLNIVEIIRLIGERLNIIPIITNTNDKLANWSIENSEIVDRIIHQYSSIKVDGYTKSVIDKYIN
jgi:nucleoside-diphosphate-sugar epimerase